MDLGQRFIFMKVGNHAGESWDSILERKRKEFEKVGRIFWGYGGTACHPLHQAQPFARLAVKETGEISLVMQPIDSKADPDVIPAAEFSADGINWEPIPDGIRVTGSRYAFVLDEIKPTDLEIDLRSLEVGIGPSAGKAAEDYLKGRVDKACLRSSKASRSMYGIKEEEFKRNIGFVARLIEPFAVVLR